MPSLLVPLVHKKLEVYRLLEAIIVSRVKKIKTHTHNPYPTEVDALKIKMRNCSITGILNKVSYVCADLFVTNIGG